MTAQWLVFIVTIPALLLAALIVAALSRHKKSAVRALSLIGEIGFVEFKLDPEGAVIVNGELWRARANGGRTIAVRNRVHVVGTETHLLLVEPLSLHS